MIRAGIIAVAVSATVAGCAGPPATGDGTRILDRSTAVWAGPDGLDEVTATRLLQIGVDRVVVWRGRISIAGSTPIVRLEPWPEITGPLPVAAAYRLDSPGGTPPEAAAGALWQALSEDIADGGATEIVLDLPIVHEGLGGLVAQLSTVSGLPVVPVLSVEQLRSEPAVAAAIAAGSCIVPLFGRANERLRAPEQRATTPPAERLASLVGTGVRVRVGISLRPVTDPELGVWGADLDPLTEGDRCEVSTSSAYDRTFVVRRPVEWSGRSWETGDRIAIGWFDASRLDRAIAETARLPWPEVAGWDLVPLPGPEDGLGLSREALEWYLAGEGPQPAVDVAIERSGSRVTVVLSNPGPFASAVSGVGNVVELRVDGGRLVAEDRGDFDRLTVGTIRDGAFESDVVGAADAVRFHETYVAPGEQVRSGTVRLTSRGGDLSIRWEVVLSTGERIGESRRP